MDKQTLLIEIGTEELPPKALKNLSDALFRELKNGLLEAELVGKQDVLAATPFATPRRLAISVPAVLRGQPDQSIERRGPAVQAAFDQEGEPTPAAIGFARSCGVNVADLSRLKTDKGEWLSYTVEEKGKTLSELIEGIIDQAIKRLPIPKRMRWGDGSAEFVRPVKWVIVMHGSEVLPATVLEVSSSNMTRGHRFHSDGDIVINNADDYEKTLLKNGHIVADFAERRAMILEQINAAATQLSGSIEDDPALLDEVTGLVEYPAAVVGTFDAGFLSVPQECLISSMRDHQKYFHVLDQDGALLPNFITISNIQSSNPDQVREGNEKVLRARLSDAQFFWETDQKTKLADRVSKLGAVMFHAKLGSVLDKTTRVRALAIKIADKIGADQSVVERSALLAKADLVSDMVGEFDELQGIMGHYYADRDGEDPRVGDCVEQHYWPKFAGDRLPETREAQAVALADKIDSLVGIFAAGELPTGDKDPYGLRRAALSILRILIEQELTLTLSELIHDSARIYAESNDIAIDTETQASIVDFIRGRLIAFYQSQSIATNTINAVMSCEPDSPLDFEHRVKAVHVFSQLPEAEDLASANKRISNILKKQASSIQSIVDEAFLVEDSEKGLHTAITKLEAQCIKLFDAGEYQSGLTRLASLRTPVDSFFEHVMVMSDDEQLKQNRLALLKRLQDLFLRVADISLLQA